MPMRTDCKNYESRTYPGGETVRKCNLDLAPEAPWRCPANCKGYETRLADVSWKVGTLVAPPTPEEPPNLEEAAALLDEAEDIVNAAGQQILAEYDERGRRRGRSVGDFRGGGERSGRPPFWQRFRRR